MDAYPNFCYQLHWYLRNNKREKVQQETCERRQKNDIDEN